ncbi:Ina17p [Saccharomyces eubayanus]|uniref:Ina17p n=1 Tax=Saccharomyces eubayanus TaxID=1080349 RepID=UPI0006BFFEF3|nr:AIM43-like protein [Saccharomyces eubayanus]KOG96214.1 AIM43-like protein [Saccharomyces eubayanus]
MLKRSSRMLTAVSRNKLSSRFAVTYYHKTPLSQQQRATTTPQNKIKSLEDLVNLNSLDGVDPELIRSLINERTTELNIKNELDMLKKFCKEEKTVHESPMKKFVRPLWMFILMSSSVYLLLHLTWWKLERDERESELKQEVEALESQLNKLINQDKNHNSSKDDENTELSDAKPWFKKWFW